MSGGSPDAAQRVVVVAEAPVVNPDSSPAPPPPVAEGKPELPAAAQVEQKQQQQPAPAAPVGAKQAGVQAMAVTVVRDVETGVDTSTGDGAAGEKPSWFTPKRY